MVTSICMFCLWRAERNNKFMKLETDNLLTNQSVSMPKGQEINGGTGRPFLPRENSIKYRVNESSNTNNS